LSTKSKTDTKFSGISFGENSVKSWQTGSKYLTLVGARFPGKYMTNFFTVIKDIYLHCTIKKMPLQTLLLVFKICIQLGAMCCENFGRFHQLKKITNKTIKTARNTFVWALIIKIKAPGGQLSQFLFLHLPYKSF